jgi:hypothetical protein
MLSHAAERGQLDQVGDLRCALCIAPGIDSAMGACALPVWQRLGGFKDDSERRSGFGRGMASQYSPSHGRH